MKPGDYPLGSKRSRAAARHLLQERCAGKQRFTLIMDVGIIDAPGFSPWTEDEDGNLSRIASVPEGMSLEEAERIFEAKQRNARSKNLPSRAAATG